MSESLVGDEPRIQISIDRLGSAFCSMAGILDTAEWYFRKRESVVVDGHHPCLDTASECVSSLRRLGERVRSQAKRQSVGLSYRVVQSREGVHDRHRTERLLVHQPGFLRCIGNYGRREEIALVADAAAPGADFGTAFDRFAHEPL